MATSLKLAQLLALFTALYIASRGRDSMPLPSVLEAGDDGADEPTLRAL